MNTKKMSLGQLLCESFGSNWERIGFAARRDYNAAAKSFFRKITKAIDFEKDLIQERGFESLKAVDRILDPMVPAKGAVGKRGKRGYVEYHFGETTSPAVASKAAKALRSKRTGKVGRSIAASALTQAKSRRKGK